MSGYRTAQGKVVDMAQLVARNERVRAVGNMNVNARGDIIDSHNRVIQDNTKRVKNSYTKAVQQKQQPVQTQPEVKKEAPKAQPIKEDLLADEKEFFDDDEDIKK